MVPPKYKFYVGKLDRYMYLSSNLGIDNAGEFVNESGKYSYGLGSLTKGASLLVNMQSLDSYNSVFFYDSSQKLISRVSLAAYNNQIIIPPSNAKYWAIRFTTADANFALKRQTNFIYWVQSVNPSYKELNKKYSKENGQEFFRISLDGKINLFGQDYEQVSNSNLEDQFIFVIEKYNRTSSKWLEYYKGEFSKTDCKFDHAKKKCELKTSPIDDYNEVMNKYENTYDLIKLAPEITKINMHKRSLMQVYVLGANSISNFFGGTYWEDDVNEAIDNAEDLVNKYYFAYIKAGNEFYVRNAGLSEVNGVYAGTNGYWSNWNGYTCYLDLTEANPNNICIKRNSDNAILYKSEKTWTALDSNNIYIGREGIAMINVNDSADKFTIESPFVYHIYRRLLCDIDTIEDDEGIKTLYDLPSDDFVTNNRNFKKCIGYKGGVFYCTSRAVDEPTRYGVNDYGQYFTNQFIPFGWYRPLPISRNSWANASLWFAYEDITYELNEQKLRKLYTLKDSWSIAAVIKALLKQIDPTLKHEATAEYSRFLYDESTPFGFARFYVHLTQKSNILKGDYDQPAQKAEISLEELTKMLRDCFRCYWYIEDGKFKVEHVLFFINGGAYTTSANTQLDFTKLTDQFNKKLSSYFQSEIEYDKTDLAQRYEFNWMDDATELFGGVTLDVKSNYVQKDKVEEINASQFSADVDYMLFNPSAFSNDGFALLCPIRTQVKNAAWLQGGIDAYGNIQYESNEYYSYRIRTADSYELLSRTVEINASTGFGYRIFEYDSAGAYIGFKSYDAGGLNTYTAPNNVKSIIFCLLKSNGAAISSSEGANANLQVQGVAGPLQLPIISVNLIDENEDQYTAIAQNWYASWIYLTAGFYMYDMPASSVRSNVLGDLHATVKKCMKQTIEFPIEEDLDELQLVKTDLGNGKIDEFSVNIETRQAKVKLTYSPR